MITWKSLPPDIRKRVWQAVVILLLLLAVVFLCGFTAGRWYEHGR